MNLCLLIFAVVVLHCSYFATAQCRVRVEVRDLSPAQLEEFINAMKDLQLHTDAGGFSQLDHWSEQHDVNFGNIHVERFFFPWFVILLCLNDSPKYLTMSYDMNFSGIGCCSINWKINCNKHTQMC
jgi:hypothetical protein